MPDTSLADPVAEYERRLVSRREVIVRDERLDDRISRWRLILFIAGVVTAIFTIGNDGRSDWWAAFPFGLYIGLLVLHEQVARQHTRAKRSVALYEEGLARLRDDWQDTGETGARYLHPDHPYAGDLDVFGRGSLFQLVSRCRTRLGEDTLAEWLLNPALPETIRGRQTAIGELRDDLDFREELALLEEEIGDDLDQNHLLHWARSPHLPVPFFQRVLITVLSSLTVAAIVHWALGGKLTFVLVGVALLGCFALAFGRRIRQVAGECDKVGSGLRILARVLKLVEERKFTTPYLKEVARRLETDGVPVSRRIEQIEALVRWMDNSLRNQFFVPIAFVLGLPVHVLQAIERWHERFAARIPRWLGAVGEFEALTSLAAYTYEHPGDPFPEIVDAGPMFEATSLGHPLLPRKECIRNDVSLGGERRLLLVSGSNMSGKSTLLRTIGTNVVLALAGAPVRAESLRLSPLQIGTAMRVGDSLQDGKSLFYAVVGRLKKVVDLLEADLPLLFLLDEILQGTNSHDRRVGAEGVIRRLVDDGGIGLVTTHDLALTEIVPSLEPHARNVHFEDHLVDGHMTFDYELRPGVVERSNALELMRMMGLDV